MTDKEAMKLALFALDIVKTHYTQSRHINEAITALKERLADPMRGVQRLGQEIKQDFHLHDEDNEGGWTDWICPKPDSYLVKCCDCGLVHEMQTRVVDYESRPSEDFVVSNNPDLQAQFRVRRHEVFDTAPPQRTEQEPVGSVVRWMDSSLIHGWFGDPPPEGTLLYTHPPQRTWVDLTDTQIEQVYFDVVKEHRGAPMPWGQVQFGRALLDKFKEANT